MSAPATRRSLPARLARAGKAFMRLGWHRRLLLGESALLLTFASAAIAFLPFRTVARMAAGRPPTDARGATADVVAEIRWAVNGGCRITPWRTVCFQRGLTAHLMLRRRGLASVLHYGVARDPQRGVRAHVWVRAGDLDVVGCEDIGDCVELARFPAP